MQIRIKRVYDRPTPADGRRVLVDRLWPRGLRKEDAAIDVWARELAPSSGLRKWFNHEDKRFSGFAHRYNLELDSAREEIDKLLASIGSSTATLLFAAKNIRSNHAIVLKARLERRKRATE